MKRTPLLRRKGLRRISVKRLAYESQLDEMRSPLTERSRGRCEARCTDRCTGFAQHVHHRLRRSQGGTNALDNLLHCCRECHDYVHRHPSESYLFGWLVRSTS